MDVSIVITTRNRKKYLLECIDSIKKSDFDKLDWELIVVDDNSSDGTEKIFDKDLNINSAVVIHNISQKMMVVSRNIGAKRSSGRVVVFIDDDNVIDNQMIKILVEFMDKNEKYGIAGPSMYYFDTAEKYMDYQKISLFTGHTRGLISSGDKNFYESDGVPNVFAVRKEVFEKCGYFDESIIQTFTEPDFAKMIERCGYMCCIVPEAKTYHKIKREGYTSPMNVKEKFNQKAYCSMRNRTVYISRYGSLLNKIVYLLFFSWFWPTAYSLSALKNGRHDLVRLYWRGFIDGVIYFMTGTLRSPENIS